MKILLINTNREHAPQPVVPMGLCLVASALEGQDFQVRLLDLCFSRQPLIETQRVLADWKPEVIGLSIRNLDNGEYLQTRAYLPAITEIARVCKDNSSAKIIIGGPAVSIAPEQLLRLMQADYAVVGEGEEVVVELTKAIAGGLTPASISGICSANAGDHSAWESARVENFGSIAAAQPKKWLDLNRYLRWGSPFPVQSKRGCGLKCIHCTYRLIEGARYRLRSPEETVEEMKEAKARLGVRRFEFIDSTFNHPPAHALALCETIVQKELRSELHTMALNPIGLSKELLELMKRAGFSAILCTPDSGSSKMLKIMRKGFEVDQIAKTAGWAREIGLGILWSFMFGAPGETEETVRETISFIEKTLGPRDRILCTIGLRIYPGTELELIAREEGAIAAEADLLNPVFYNSPHISPARIVELIEGSCKRSHMIYLGALQQASLSHALRLRAALHLPGPAWANLPIYNFFARFMGGAIKGGRQ
jgi:hypothetical protein